MLRKDTRPRWEKMTKRRECGEESRSESKLEAIKEARTGGEPYGDCFGQIGKNPRGNFEGRKLTTWRRSQRERVDEEYDIQNCKLVPPREYVVTTECLVLNNWIHDMECFLEQSRATQRPWVKVASWYLKKAVLFGGAEGTLWRLGGFQAKDKGVFH